jgi:hypothetical protein
MYVRLGFSVAINVDPDILLVDEVLAVGDEAFQRRCAEKFSDFRRAGKTIVLVSHAMGQLRTLCDQVAWLEHGTVKEVGSPGNIVDDYVGEAHTERESGTVPAGPADARENRWGSGEVRVESFELLDGAGRPTRSVRTGDPVTVRLRWSAVEPVPRPVFGVAVHSIEGIEVTGPNTRDADLVPEKIDGTGVVDLHVPRLLLLPGRYDLSAAVYDFTRQHPYDHRHRAYRFDVEPGRPREEHGLTSLGGTWTMDP